MRGSSRGWGIEPDPHGAQTPVYVLFSRDLAYAALLHLRSRALYSSLTEKENST